MQKKFPFNISTITAFMITIYMAYYLLLADNFLHCSISSIISYSTHLAIKKHIMIFGLLPIYIATMIFGSALIGAYLGSKLEVLCARCTIKSN